MMRRLIVRSVVFCLWLAGLTSAGPVGIGLGSSGSYDQVFPQAALSPSYSLVNGFTSGSDPLTKYSIYDPTVRVGGVAVVYVGGVGHTWRSLLDDTGANTLLLDFLSQGWICAESQAHGENYGNTAAVADYTALIALLEAAPYNCTKIVVVAQSMGGNAGLGVISTQHADTKIKGIILIYAQCSLAAVWAQTGPSTASDLATAYSIVNLNPSGAGSYSVQTAGSDNYLKSASLFTIPMMFFSSASDATVVEADHTTPMIAKCLALSSEITKVPHRGIHGNIDAFQPVICRSAIKRWTQ